MTRHLSRLGALVLAGAVAFSLGTPAVASAQRTQTSGANDGGRSGGGDSGGRAVAVPRSDTGSRGGDSGGGRASAPAPAPAPASSPASTRSSSESSADGGGQGRAVPRRAREDRPVVGNAVPRSSVPPYGGNIIVGGGYPYYSYYPYYPWYYPGYYPWGYGGIGFGFSWYSPGYYGYGAPYYGGGGYAHYDGAVRIKVKPSRAEVLVDGYYVGIVDEFDNPFQQLQLESGPHRIEVRADGYEPVSFEVRIVSGRTTTYKAELKKLP